MKPKEGDEDFVPFYDNHADIYGFVTIVGETFNLPQIPETDFPHWEADGPRKGTFGAGGLRWAELLRRIFEVDPLACPRCRGLMRIVAVIIGFFPGGFFF